MPTDTSVLPRVYVAFYWGTAWYSKVIEWFTNGPSHAALVYVDDEFGAWLQLGSEANGWVFIPCRTSDILRAYELPGIDLWKGVRKQIGWLNAPYDFGGLFGMAWVMVAWRWFKMKVRNPLQSRKAWFCSEMVAQICRDSGMTLDLEPGEMDPGRLEKELSSKGAVLVSKERVFGAAI